ncbi:MAG: hypothetical protein JWO45_1609 [Spartobacteria bacterium]|nr:hypothetical protein [Spartobacteria bacterium]
MPEEQKRPEISRAALVRDLGEPTTRALFRKPLPPGTRIPAYEKLKVGDVILSRRRKHNFVSRNIVSAQREHGHDENDCTWTHAMLYVGDLHVAESTKAMKWRTNVQIVPLTHYSDFDLLVLRHTDEGFPGERQYEIVRHGLLMQSIYPRRYDWPSAFSVRYARTLKFHLPRSILFERIFCSEFVLECFALKGGYMIDQYVDVRDQNRNPPYHFLPADFLKVQKFQKIEMEYYDLVTHSHPE